MFDSIKAGPWSGHSTPEAKRGQLIPLPSLWQLECRSMSSRGQRDPPIRDFECGRNDSKGAGLLRVNLKHQRQNCESATQQLVSRDSGDSSFLSIPLPQQEFGLVSPIFCVPALAWLSRSIKIFMTEPLHCILSLLLDPIHWCSHSPFPDSRGGNKYRPHLALGAVSLTLKYMNI